MIPTQEQIEAVWKSVGIVPTGQDMSNECRLAARVISLMNSLQEAVVEHIEKPKISVYVASRFKHQNECKKIRAQLVVHGFDVTSRWLEEEPSLESTLTDEQREGLAEMDVFDVKRARALVLYNPVEEKTYGTGGCHYECGLAAAMGMPIFILGPKTNIFHWRKNVFADFKDVESLSQALRYVVKDIKGHGESKKGKMIP